MNQMCPVCFYPDLPYAPADYNICPCCGTEFGNDDADLSHSQLRGAWIAGGLNWFFGRPPSGWNPWLQLERGGAKWLLPIIVPIPMKSSTNSKQKVKGQEIQFEVELRA